MTLNEYISILSLSIIVKSCSISDPKRRKNEDSGVVKNPHGPDVQWANKSRDKSKDWEGYKAQIAETVPDGD